MLDTVNVRVWGVTKNWRNKNFSLDNRQQTIGYFELSCICTN